MVSFVPGLTTSRVMRIAGVTAADGALTAVSFAVALFLRMNGQVPPRMLDGLASSLPVVGVTSAVVFFAAGSYRRVWRYISATDLVPILMSVTVAIAASVAALAITGRVAWMPRSVPFIQWFILVVMLAGTRLAWRMFCERVTERRSASHKAESGNRTQRALLVGTSHQLDIILRFMEANPDVGYQAVGVLDDVAGHLKLRLRGIPILGSIEMIEDAVGNLERTGLRPEAVIIVDGLDQLVGPAFVRFVTRAEALGLTVARLPDPARPVKTGGELDLRFINLAELLGRPQAPVDAALVSRLVASRSVLVTGAGGTIGRELVRQIAAFGPSKLVLVDNCEFNLYAVDQELQEMHPDIPRTALLCSIRQREALMNIFAAHRPELVFHAAALKHVPLAEENPCAAVQTNVIGTRNVADAARRYGVRAMVQVSTDKAVNPVGIMGATKRLGELYCQSLDLDGQGRAGASRFLTVRFGNVLGSSGSLIPLFQHQLSRRMPLTVTHPSIERYFMTVQEAVQLVLQSTACALECGTQRGRIFVLDMGKPIKIMDIAHRMIRLAGLEPDVDVKINIIGLRPGEKLYEELFDETEQQLPSHVPGILEAEPNPVALNDLILAFDRLRTASIRDDETEVRALIVQTLQQSHCRTADVTGTPEQMLAPPPLAETRRPVAASSAL